MVLAENLNHESREEEENEQLKKYDCYKGTQLEVRKINLIGCYVKGSLIVTYKSCEDCEHNTNYPACVSYRKRLNRYEREFSDHLGHTYL
jgi:hypothetical protein